MYYYLKTQVGTWLIGPRDNGAYDLRMYFPHRGYNVLGRYECAESAKGDVENYCTGFDLWDLNLSRMAHEGLDSILTKLEWAVSSTQPDLNDIHK